MKLLVIEDDRETAAYLVKGLSESGYTVDHSADGRDGLFLATSGSHDAIILDRMLPSMDGLALLGALRAAQIRTPALILSALGSVDDRVKGLRSGGDDYLVKPFAFSELLARIEALLRRGVQTPPWLLRSCWFRRRRGRLSRAWSMPCGGWYGRMPFGSPACILRCSCCRCWASCSSSIGRAPISSSGRPRRRSTPRSPGWPSN